MLTLDYAVKETTFHTLGLGLRERLLLGAEIALQVLQPTLPGYKPYNNLFHGREIFYNSA